MYIHIYIYIYIILLYSIRALSTLVTAMSSTLIQAALMSPSRTKHVSADRYIYIYNKA